MPASRAAGALPLLRNHHLLPCKNLPWQATAAAAASVGIQGSVRGWAAGNWSRQTGLSLWRCLVQIMFCGELEYYDKSYDRVTPKASCPLRKTSRVFRSVTTSDDPIIR